MALVSLPNINIFSAIEPTLGALIFNWDEDEDDRFFSLRRIRIALQSGIDISGTIDRHLSNMAVQADSPLIPGLWAYQGQLPWQPYDPQAAAAILSAQNDSITTEDAESPSGNESPIRSFSILVPSTTPLVSIAQEIATQWSAYNLDIGVESVDSVTYEDRILSGEFDAAIVELPMGANPDGYAFWHAGQHPEGLNFGKVSDTRLSEILEQARRSSSGINRAQLYARFQQTFADRGIAIPLYYPLYTYAVHPRIDGVQLGYIASPSDRFRTLTSWQFTVES